MATTYEIGVTEIGMTDLAALSPAVDYPKGEYQPYSKLVRVGDGSVRGFGLPIARWSFPVITNEVKAKLRSYCSGASAEVYIATKLNDDTFGEFVATMIWPEDENRWGGGHFQNLTIEFRDLVSLA